jgi:5'-nucleotidase
MFLKIKGLLKMKRRDFIKTALIAGASLQFSTVWTKKLPAQDNLIKITILQTNDTHSRIDPFPMDGSRNQGCGGIARRATLVKKVRELNPHTLLLDAGDVFQGTPYFNFYKGKIEYLTMSKCDYDASTLGNHEFDLGVEPLVTALNYASFPIINCNYDFGNTTLDPIVKTSITKQLSSIKIGITGVGIDFIDLVTPNNHKGIVYGCPVESLKKEINHLRNNLGCDFIVVLSHLGYKYKDGTVSDQVIAREVDGIDWIIGGHTHTFMKQPELIISEGGYETRILQVGFAGILLGKSDFYFEGKKLVHTETSLMEINSEVEESIAIFDALT